MVTPAKRSDAKTSEKQIPRVRNALGTTGLLEPEGELVTGGVVAGLRVDVERRQTAGGAELDLDFAPAGVMNLVTRPISQNILVTQLHANF